jgi:hypothetical protein
VQEPNAAQTQKRRLDGDPVLTSSIDSHSPFTADLAEPRSIAGSKRVEQYHQQSALFPETVPFSSTDYDFVLPVHSDELGRLPLASDFDFSAMSSAAGATNACTASWQPQPPQLPQLHGPDSSLYTGTNVNHHPQLGSVPLGMPQQQDTSSTQQHQQHQQQQQRRGIDPNLEAIFSDLLPAATYQDAFAALMQTNPNVFFTGAGPLSTTPLGGRGEMQPEPGLHATVASTEADTGVGMPFDDSSLGWDAGPGSTA